MIYEFWCEKCDLIFDEFRDVAECKNPASCPKCECQSNRIISGGQAALNPRSNNKKPSRIPGWCESLPGKPVYVKSKAHFRELCKPHDLYPAGLA